MANDALERGDGSYPWFPRHADGTPAWSFSPETDGIRVSGRGPDGLVSPMPTGIRHIIRGGRRIATDMTPRDANGDPIIVPKIP